MHNYSTETMMKRPASAAGRRRPVCEYARKAAMMSGNFRYKVKMYLDNCNMNSLDSVVRSTCNNVWQMTQRLIIPVAVGI